MTRLLLRKELRGQIEREARTAFPRECCGLIEGIRDGDVICATALHATRNVSSEADRFEIDPAEHIRILRTARATSREIIGCYHSHPNGKSELSARDREGMCERGFVWLIAALTENSPMRLSAYISAFEGTVRLEL